MSGNHRENKRPHPPTLAIDGGTPVRQEYLVFGRPCLGEEEIAEVVDTLRSGWIGQGGKTQLFESRFASYIGCKHALALNSCTAGLHLSLLVSGIKPGDEVITTPMTFVATVNSIVHVGAKPVFVDIDPVTLNIDPRLIEEKITDRTKAILPVHFGGLPCEMEHVESIASGYGLAVIQDAAHAIGARYNGKRIGNHGSLTSFSFYANKNITTAEGGMVTTDDDAIAEKINIYRLHGLSSDAWQRYRAKELITSEAIFPGFKYNMTDLQASIGLHQLAKVERFLQTREAFAELYDEAFGELEEVSLQPRPADIRHSRHALHLYVLRLKLHKLRADRDQFVRAMRAENVGVGVHYSPVHLHPYYRETFRSRQGDFPNAEKISESVMSLPLTPGMSQEDVHDVIAGVRKVLAHYSKRHVAAPMPCQVSSAGD